MPSQPVSTRVATPDRTAPLLPGLSAGSLPTVTSDVLVARPFGETYAVVSTALVKINAVFDGFDRKVGPSSWRHKLHGVAREVALGGYVLSGMFGAAAAMATVASAALEHAGDVSTFTSMESGLVMLAMVAIFGASNALGNSLEATGKWAGSAQLSSAEVAALAAPLRELDPDASAAVKGCVRLKEFSRNIPMTAAAERDYEALVKLKFARSTPCKPS